MSETEKPVSGLAQATGYATAVDVALELIETRETRQPDAKLIRLMTKVSGLRTYERYPDAAGRLLAIEVRRLRDEVARIKSHNTEADRRVGESHETKKGN